MLALFIGNFENNNGISLSTTSVTISNLWLPVIAGILADCMESTFLPAPNLYM